MASEGCRGFFPATLFIIIIVYFMPVESIKCYVCRSDANDDCAKDLSDSLVEECPVRPQSTTGYCRKILQQLYFKKESTVTTIRECAYEKNTKQCYRTKWSNAAYQETCECDKDLCNRSSNSRSFGKFTLMTSVLLYTYFLFR